MPTIRTLRWVGAAKKDLGAMPADVQDTFGYALHLAQAGDRHSQAKPLKGFGGAGVLEVVEDHQGDNLPRCVYRTLRLGGVRTVLLPEEIDQRHCHPQA